MREKIINLNGAVVSDPWHNKSGAIDMFQAQIKPGTVFMSGCCIIASTQDGGLIKVTSNGVIWNKVSSNGRHHKVYSHCRDGRVCLDLSTPKGGRTTVSLETIWYVLYQMAFGGRQVTPGLVVNHKANDNSKATRPGRVALGPQLVEVVTLEQNNAHGKVWNRVFQNIGLRLCFSALDMAFIGYVNALVNVTREALEAYPSSYWDTIQGIDYLVIS
jgi:hypothetical protein